MTKELFIETIEQIKEQFNYDKKCNNALEIIFPNQYIYYCPTIDIIGRLIKVLKVEMKDKSDWIDYYIYELNFGKYWKKGMITSEDKKDIKLKTPLDLWNIITKRNK